jgi:hypothetical protein
MANQYTTTAEALIALASSLEEEAGEYRATAKKLMARAGAPTAAKPKLTSTPALASGVTLTSGANAQLTGKVTSFLPKHDPSLGPLTLQSLRAYVHMRGGRPAHVAASFGVPVEDVKKMVAEPGSGVQVADRGFLKLNLAPPAPQPQPRSA